MVPNEEVGLLHIKNASEKDDVTQEVFVTVYQKLNIYKCDSTKIC